MEAQAPFSHATRRVHKREERIRLMIRELSLNAASLANDIEAALQWARVQPRDYAYPSYAKATAQRRDNLLRTVENLKGLIFSESAAA
jgi:hypothetical protein